MNLLLFECIRNIFLAPILYVLNHILHKWCIELSLEDEISHTTLCLFTTRRGVEAYMHTNYALGYLLRKGENEMNLIPQMKQYINSYNL